MSAIVRRVRAIVLAGCAVFLLPTPATAQRALIYCPVGADAAGCGVIAAALASDPSPFPDAAAYGYDGTEGTVDLATADLSGYAAFIVPSLADGAGATPYAVLRNAEVAARIRAAFPGRSALWSGTPDRGSTNRTAKNQLLRNLAAWVRADAAVGLAGGVMALQDNSDDAAARYGWLAGVASLWAAADTTLESYSNVEVVTNTGRDLLTNPSGLQIGYGNMASFGLVIGSGATADATGGRSGRVVLATAAGAAGEGIATVRTDKEDYEPGETVVITGSGWEPGETVSMRLHEEPVVHGDRTLTAVADEQGNIFNDSFHPEEHDLGVRFVLTATGQTSGRTAQTTFTDNRVVTAASVDGGTSTVVLPGGTLTASVTVQTSTGGGGGENWFSTAYRIATTPPGTTTCVDIPNPDRTAVGTFTESFTATAPVTPGTYNAYFIAWRTAACGNNASNTFTLPNAVIVSGATKLAFTSSAFTTVVGQCSPAITVQTHNAASAPTNPSVSTTVNLTSSSTGGAFYSDAACTTAITSAVIPTSANSATFRYKDTKASGPTLTASAAPLANATQVETVNKAATSTAILSHLPDPSEPGAAVTVTYAVSVTAPGAGTPTGNVTVSASGGSETCTGTVAAGSCAITLTVSGSRTLTATYAGDADFTTSTSPGVAHQIVIGTSTALTRTVGSTPSIYGDALTFTATVTRTSGPGAVDAGTVTFKSGTCAAGTTLGGPTAVSPTGVASYSTSALTVTGSPWTISACYEHAAGLFSPSENSIAQAVNQKALTITAENKARTYGEDNPPFTVAYDGFVLAETAAVLGGTLSCTTTATVTSSVAGSPYPITCSGQTAANYALTYVPGQLTITARALTVTATAENKVYDGTTDATVTLADDRVNADALTIGYTGASFDTKQVGSAKTVTVTGISLAGAAAGNYALANTTAIATADITQRALTVTATGIDKVYDGTTDATVTLADDRITGDVLTIGYTAAFDTKQVGAGKTVTVSGFSLAGADGGNYSVTGSITTTAAITTRTLVVTATAENKVYDATTAATVALSDDRVTGDVVTVSYTAATFADKQVGTGKTVTVAGLALAGTDGGNYVLAATSVTATADISPATVSPQVTAENKVYDGTTDATIATRTVTGTLLTDVVTLEGGTASFADKNVGAGKTVTGTGFTLGGADGGNYVLDPATATTTADITQRTLTVTATAENKVYDATTAATVALADDRITGDVFVLTHGPATFDTKNVGTGKTVTVGGITIGAGADGGNYVLGNATALATADITPASLAPQITAENKVYDATTDATIATRAVTGTLLTDVVTLEGGTASFADKNVGTARTVTGGGFTLGGADGGNYVLDPATATTTADITPRTLTATATGVNKVYDATTAATVTLQDDRFSGDILTLSYAAAAFADKNVGTAKPISVTGIAISGGADANNYTLSGTTATAAADITSAAVAPQITAENKIYDGDPSATIATRTLAGILLTDDVTLTGGTAAFADKNAGTGKTVTATGFGLEGVDAGNYQLDPATATTTADISQRPLAVTATGVNKVYDATTDATVTLQDDRVSGDVLAASYAAAAFADKNVGVGKPVSVTGISIAGTDAPNYALGNTTAATTADITTAALQPVITADDKIYDGTTDATILTRALLGILASDDVALTGGTATFADANAGIGKTVTGSGFGLTGGDAGNYVLAPATATTTADIDQRPITVTANSGQNKTYGDPDPVFAYQITVGSLVTGDGLSGVLTRDAGETVAGSPYAILVGGLTAGPNYILSFVSAGFTIEKAPLAVVAGSTSKVYGDLVPALGGSITGQKLGDVITATYTAYVAAGGIALVNATTPVSGSPYPIIPDVAGTPSATLANYTVTLTNGSLSVVEATPVFSALTVPNVVFGQGTSTVTGNLAFGGTGGTVYPTGSVSVTVSGQNGTATIQANGSFTATITTASIPANGPGHTVAISYNGSDPNFTSAAGAGAMKVLYNTAAGHQFLQPINPNLTTGNRSSFKIGSTIPTKFQLFRADGTTAVTTAVATISVLKIDNSPDNPINEEVITLPPDAGNTFRVSSNQYHYNLGTKGWTAGTYRITATLDDGSKITAEVDGRSK